MSLMIALCLNTILLFYPIFLHSYHCSLRPPIFFFSYINSLQPSIFLLFYHYSLITSLSLLPQLSFYPSRAGIVKDLFFELSLAYLCGIKYSQTCQMFSSHLTKMPHLIYAFLVSYVLGTYIHLWYLQILNLRI